MKRTFLAFLVVCFCGCSSESDPAWQVAPGADAAPDKLQGSDAPPDTVVDILVQPEASPEAETADTAEDFDAPQLDTQPDISGDIEAEASLPEAAPDVVEKCDWATVCTLAHCNDPCLQCMHSPECDHYLNCWMNGQPNCGIEHVEGKKQFDAIFWPCMEQYCPNGY